MQMQSMRQRTSRGTSIDIQGVYSPSPDPLVRTVKAIQSFDYDLEVSLTDAEERVDQSITAIKVSSGVSLADGRQA